MILSHSGGYLRTHQIHSSLTSHIKCRREEGGSAAHGWYGIYMSVGISSSETRGQLEQLKEYRFGQALFH